MWVASVLVFTYQIASWLFYQCPHKFSYTWISFSTGVVSGKFIERTRIKKPGQELYNTELSKYYTANDLYVGARVDFNRHKFALIDADDYAYNYMERNGHPHANMSRILQKLAPVACPVTVPGCNCHECRIWWVPPADPAACAGTT